MTGRFIPEQCAAGVFSTDGSLTVTVAGERPNLRNFWSGKWVSNWDVSFSPGEATVVGSIKVLGHFVPQHATRLMCSVLIFSALECRCMLITLKTEMCSCRQTKTLPKLCYHTRMRPSWQLKWSHTLRYGIFYDFCLYAGSSTYSVICCVVMSRSVL